MLKRLRERNEWKFFAVLPQADGRLAFVWWLVVLLRGVLPAVFAIAMGALVDGRAERRQPDRAARVHRCRLRPAADPGPAPDRRQPQPWRPHRGLALRPPDPRLRASSRHGAPRRSQADRRPHRGARLRPRHDRSAAVVRARLHRRRTGGNDRRCSPRPPCSSPTRGGRRSSSPAPGSPRTGSCARAPSGTTATPTKCGARSATPTTRIGWPWIRRAARSCDCSVWSAGRSIASSPAARSCTSSSTTPPVCASVRCSGACCWSPSPT